MGNWKNKEFKKAYMKQYYRTMSDKKRTEYAKRRKMNDLFKRQTFKKRGTTMKSNDKELIDLCLNTPPSPVTEDGKVTGVLAEIYLDWLKRGLVAERCIEIAFEADDDELDTIEDMIDLCLRDD